MVASQMTLPLLALSASLVTLGSAQQQQTISAASFGAAAPFTLPFWSTELLGTHIKPPASTLASEYNSALLCGANSSRGGCMFDHDDEWVGRVLPMWRKVQDTAYAPGQLTIPFMRNISAVRMLGGVTSYSYNRMHNSSFKLLPHWDLCYRDGTGTLIYNWTRMDLTLDAFVAAGITPSPIVLDDTPYAFVKPENRFIAPEDSARHTHFHGHGAAPDNATAFGEFIEAMVQHLVVRYGHSEVSTWGFRLGTECMNPRMGPPWVGDDGNGVVALPTADGTFKNFSHGLDQYIATYIAASSAVKRVVPGAKVGPCNLVVQNAVDVDGDGLMHAHEVDQRLPNAGLTGYAQVNDLFATRLYAARAPVDFIAMTSYSKSVPGGVEGYRHVAPHLDKVGVERITEIGLLATTGKKTGSQITIPVEVHEYGWAGWGGYRGGFRWPHGSFGAAYNVASWLWMRQAGVERIFSWGYKFDDSLAVANPEASGATAAHAGRPLISGWGWTLGAMEVLLGTDGDTIGAEMVVDTPCPDADPPYNYTFGVFRMAQPKAKTLHYLLTAFSGDFTDHSTMDITLSITAADFPETSGGNKPFWDLANRSAVAITERVFNRTTCTHDQIRADLDAAGGYQAGLVNEELPVVDAVNEMSTPAGLDIAAKGTKRYLAMSDSSLLPRPFSGEVVVDGDSVVVTLRGVERPSLVLLSFAAVQFE
tara:strand:- start:2554 stop:4665 length:2112 start_codon:yes stop_codon:yes gene_type:complete